MRRAYCAIFYIQCIFLNICLGELTAEKKQEFLNGFIQSLNGLPDQPYTYEEGVLVDAQKIDEENNYKISVRLKVSDIHDVDVVKILKCTGSVVDGINGVTVQTEHQCEEDPEVAAGDAQDLTDNGSSTELPAEGNTGPVQLDNEVQSDAEVTSGERFVAIPRPSAPCIGCASHVDPNAAGVPEMAHLGIRHLDLHDPNSKHVLNTVVEVERQVQVVNGVRYILTLLVDYNNCTAPDAEPCPVSTPCKISILEKPWKKLPDGSKYRAIVANNCTAEWIFGDEGEVLPSERNNENNELYPDASGSFDDDLKVVHNFDTQAQPNQEKPITDEIIKSVEEQIIPLNEFTTPESLKTVPAAENPASALENSEHVHEDETVKHYNENSAPAQQSQVNQPSSLNEDQKRAIDDMMNFFNFAGFHKPEGSVEHQRSKRSYDYDLKILALAKQFQNVKRSIDNANYVHELAQAMIEYLNEHDMDVKDRVLKDVLAAEQEIENDKHFFYLQVLITIPCDKAQCKAKDDVNKICNGIIDSSNKKFPQILNTFCYDDEKEHVLNKVKTVPFDDPILVKLAKRALMKIESESTKGNAMKILKFLDATTQKTSGRLTRISMLLSHTNCKKSLEFYQRLNCSTVADMGTEICDVTIHENKDLKITYICNERGVHESFVDTEHLSKKNKMITDPEIHNMVREALQYLEKQSNRNNKQKVVAIKSVSTKVVAGLLTDVIFTVGYTDCKDDKDVDSNTCKLLVNEAVRECTAQVWDRPWLENGRQFNVKCNSKSTNFEDNEIPKFENKSLNIHKRHTRLGGQIENKSNDPKYKQLAEESLQKYLESNGISVSHKVVQVTKVTTQVVAGLITEIDFDVYPTNGDTFDCHSKIWEQQWLNKKDITVTCNINGQQSRVKRAILAGGVTEKDPNHPKYNALALESLQKYLQTTGSTLENIIIKITRVTSQVVSGTKTTIYFDVLSSNSATFNCISAVWEQSWLNNKEITVDCNINNKLARVKRQPVGGYEDQNANDPKYKQLAEESLQKYLKSITGGPLQLKKLVVSKVTTQLVAGTITRIDFDVYPVNGDSIKCHSEVWEQTWIKKKDITVNCSLSGQETRKKRQLLGSEIEKDPRDPKYSVLAAESLQKYCTTSGVTLNERTIEVTKVTAQVVAGTITRIDFTVRPANGDLFTCHSEVFEQPWLNKKEITVNCNMNNKRARVKRQIPGGQNEIDPHDPKYSVLAEESLQKYLQTTGSTLENIIIKITRVISQVVSGTKTTIYFDVLSSNSDTFNCISAVWEQSWLNNKEITVDCNINNKLARVKRQPVGGYEDQNANDPKYKQLAEESLEKYLKSITGGPLQLKKLVVSKVTTQLVAGTITRIDFDVYPANGDSIKCHSEVWEQTWIKKKDITVNCSLSGQETRKKRQVTGGQTEKDPRDPKYSVLAAESLQKYCTTSGVTLNERTIEVTKVTAQVVAGTITRIDFTVRPANGDLFTCHSEVFEQPWLNKKEITVNCNMNNKRARVKRQVPGGQNEIDPHDPKYSVLAEESLQKYCTTSGVTLNERKIEVTKVTAQVVAGTITRIDFTVRPTNGDLFTCHSEVFDQPWLNKKEITVNCNMTDQQKRRKREISGSDRKRGSPQEEDSSKPEYKVLAEQSLQKFMKSQDTKTRHDVLEVKRVTSQVVAGRLYEIDFTATPTTCSVDDVNLSKCRAKNETLLFCHSKIWSRAWLKSNKIEVICNSDSDIIQTDDAEDEKKRSITGEAQGEVETNNLNFDDEINNKEPAGAKKEIINRNKEYTNLAEETVLKFERLSNSKYKHKILKIHHVSKQVNEGIMTSIEFSMSPTKCLIGGGLNVDECQFKDPKVEFLCFSTIWERSWIYLKDIKVTCKNLKAKHVKPVEWDDEIPGARQIEREKRQLRVEDDDYIDDDLSFYYADRAVKEINDKSQSHNLQKLITVHAVDDSVQMGARMIRMYIETAVTFCLRPQAGVELSECEEIDGLNRKLCHVRLWPDSEDELIVQHMAVVCDDDSDFSSVTGLSIPFLITASIKEIEKSQNIKFKLVHQGEPNIVPTLSSKHPVKMSFVVASTNCSKDVDVYKHRDVCFVDTSKPSSACESLTWLVPNSMEVKDVTVKCYGKNLDRKKRSLNISANMTSADITIAQLVDESLEKLESSSTNRYKQRVMQINSYSTKIRKGRVTTIDFDVGFTSCLKYEYIKNISTCEFMEHLPRRHCISHVFERLWVDNGRNIEVICEDDETSLEPHVGLENSEMAMQLAEEALKHIEAKYPYPRRLKVVRIFSLEKQALAGIHYRMKLEVGVTDCMALSVKSDCKLKQDTSLNKFCRVNVWIRPWTEHAPNFRVWCDYHESLTTEHHHVLQAEQLFYDFLTTHNPDYVDDYTEMAKRFAIFSANVRKVHELNVHEKGTARYAMTQFSDLTYEEFTSKYLGLKTSLKNANNIPLVNADIPEVTLPDKFDWRDRGAVTEVKNQGSCGSCWAFSVTGNIEGQWKLQTGQLVSLSEQELVDCDKSDQGCNGGLMDNAYRAIEELGGLELETDYPYEEEDDKCVFNKTLSKVQISGAVNISSNETNMAKWLVKNGPISIGINANAMQFYVGGISHPWKVLCSPSNLDHGVLIVGFGAKDYPLFHKHLPYWVIKNSWGPSWGEQGYYRVYRGDGTCGVNQMASSAIV